MTFGTYLSYLLMTMATSRSQSKIEREKEPEQDAEKAQYKQPKKAQNIC